MNASWIFISKIEEFTLRWRHNGHDGVSNHQPRDCLLNRLFRCRSKKASKLRVTGLCEGNSPVSGEFPAQRASNAENVSIWWRHHDNNWPQNHEACSTCDQKYTPCKSIRVIYRYNGIALYQSWPPWNLYYDCEKYPLSPLKPRSLAFIEQYLPNISDPVYAVHQSFTWFLWLNWRKSTFFPSLFQMIRHRYIQEPTASHCDVTMTDCFRVVSIDAFLAQFCWPLVF